MLSYKQFLRAGIDLAPLGVERREGADNAGYFCTPRGASVIGWAGVDGIHYCFVRGYGDTVFAVNPSNGAPDYVHVLARSFEDFLRLLLAAGDAAYPEQAWMWDEARFSAELAAAEITGEAKAALEAIRGAFRLTPMEAPWRYLHALQEDFDYSKLRYPPEMYDIDMNPAPPVPAWEVRADGGFPGSGRAAREIALGARVLRADAELRVPAVYVSGKSVVADLVRAVPLETLRAYRAKYERGEPLSPEERAAAEAENPFDADDAPRLTVNGETLAPASGTFLYFDPDAEAAEPWMRAAMEHYALDASCGWVLERHMFRRARTDGVRSLSLTLLPRTRWLPGKPLTLRGTGDEARFVHPGTGAEYTLRVTEWEETTLPAGDYGFPQHCVLMRFTISPELSGETFAVTDDNPADTEHAAIGIIGGADGPTAIFVSPPSPPPGGAGYAAVSSLHYDTGVQPAWRIRFRVTRGETAEIRLL